MEDIKYLKETINNNFNRLGKIFADGFCLDSIESLQGKYAYYMDCIIKKPQESKNKLIPFNKFNCVYFLIEDDYVLYVGQTSHLCARISTHTAKGKSFDSVSWCEVDTDEMLIIEAFNISHHNPSLNMENPNMKELLLMIAKKIR